MSDPCVLIFAGLDPSGGAGLLADAEAVRGSGARPLCVATALTVQTTRRARGFQPCAPSFLQECGRALLEEEDVRAVKIGMLATPQLARAIADLLADFPRLPVVLDPVLAASSGALLFKGSPDEARAAVALLWSRAVLTPNAVEAGFLLGGAPVRSAFDQEQAARALLRAGVRAVVIKGGHTEGEESIDLLAERPGDAFADPSAEPIVTRLASPRLAATARGTGCRFASALAAGLARGVPLAQAAGAAKLLVSRYLESAKMESNS
jgi:hydroxymethylpyrimidine/phosphomethylpyrimidine kinase